MAAKAGPSSLCFCPAFQTIQAIWQLWQKQIGCDVTFVSSDQTQFLLHKLLLLAKSSYFQMHEDSVTTPENVFIKFPHVQSDTLIIIIGHLYGEKVSLSEKNITEIYSVATELGLNDLIKLCDEFQQGLVSASVINELINHDVEEESETVEHSDDQTMVNLEFSDIKEETKLTESSTFHGESCLSKSTTLTGVEEQTENVNLPSDTGECDSDDTVPLQKEESENMQDVKPPLKRKTDKPNSSIDLADSISASVKRRRGRKAKVYTTLYQKSKKKTTQDVSKKKGDVVAVKEEKKIEEHCQTKNHVKNKEPFPCEVCGKLLKNKPSLVIHMRVHTGERPFGCEICGKAFMSKSDVCSHKRNVHKNKGSICHLCGKICRSRSGFHCHMLTHADKKNYQCHLCPKAFYLPNGLRRHIRAHTGVKNHICPICGKGFTESGSLSQHQVVHTGSRDHACEYCGKSFTRADNLRVHLRIHTGARPYSCNICGKKFTYTVSLASHKAKHEGRGPSKRQCTSKPQSQPSAFHTVAVQHTFLEEATVTELGFILGEVEQS